MSSRAYSDHTLCTPATDTQVLIQDDPDFLAVAFRGTESLEDFVTDAKFFRRRTDWPVSWGTIKIHDGFLSAYESIIAELHDALAKFVGKPIFITGHSLGGALAHLCAYDLKRTTRHDVRAVYTYGSPRVGNGAWAFSYNNLLWDRTYRHVLEEDIIARIPLFPSLTDLYRHAGQEYFLPASGGIDIAPSASRIIWSDIVGFARALRIQHHGPLADALDDHHIGNYLHRL